MRRLREPHHIPSKKLPLENMLEMPKRRGRVTAYWRAMVCVMVVWCRWWSCTPRRDVCIKSACIWRISGTRLLVMCVTIAKQSENYLHHYQKHVIHPHFICMQRNCVLCFLIRNISSHLTIRIDFGVPLIFWRKTEINTVF